MDIRDITIVIVSYYRGDRLQKCLETLKNIPNIIVWDNNTKGEELEKIKLLEKKYTNNNFIYSNENVGLTKAWNQGIIKSKTDWVLLTCDDMLFDEDWFDVLNNILQEKPHLEQIHLNAWNAVVFHKKTIARMGWWDERYRYYPSMEDDDWYLRTVECLNYSPYGTYAEHIPFPKEYIDAINPYLEIKKHLFDRKDNFTYYCNSIYSKYKVIGKSTITGQENDAGSRNNQTGSLDNEKNINGIQFHHMKWEHIYDPYLLGHPLMLTKNNILLSKDGRVWKRKIQEIDFYPEIRQEYIKKYFKNMKIDQNTSIEELDRILYPISSTSIDRYSIVNHWTKNKKVLDAASGKGYGAGILLSLGAKEIVGIDVDEEGIKEANSRMGNKNCTFKYADIFNLKNFFKEKEFEVCTSIETFEHLPPERIDDYLQNLKFCTSEFIIITTPRRRVPVWNYQGGTHLYEYDKNEIILILQRNFKKSDVQIFGLYEYKLPNGQWGTDISNNTDDCNVFLCVISL